MTQANKKRLLHIAKRLREAVSQNDDAQTGMFIILESLERLITVANDFHFRPEVNSDPQ